MPPARLLFGITFLPEDFPARLERFKEASGLTCDGLAACLGIDPRQLQRWRKGTKPSGDELCALVKLAARIPHGGYILFGVHMLPPGEAGRPPLVVDADREDRDESTPSPPTPRNRKTATSNRPRCSPNTGGAKAWNPPKRTRRGYGGPSPGIFPRGWSGSGSCRASRGGNWRSASE